MILKHFCGSSYFFSLPCSFEVESFGEIRYSFSIKRCFTQGVYQQKNVITQKRIHLFSQWERIEGVYFSNLYMGRAFHAEMGGKALILGPRPSQPWEITKGAGISLPMEQLQGQMSFLQQRGYRAQKTGAYSRIACECNISKTHAYHFCCDKGNWSLSKKCWSLCW